MEVQEILTIAGAAATGAAAVAGVLYYALKSAIKEYAEFAKSTPSTKDDEGAARAEAWLQKVEDRVVKLLEPLPDNIEQKIKDAFNPEGK